MLFQNKHLITLLILIISAFFALQSVFAQGTSIIPEIKNREGNEPCPTNAEAYIYPDKIPESYRNTLLACAVRTGDIHMWMVPYFIKYLAEFLIGLAGILCMLFIVIGGYQFTFAGMIEEKEKGKRTLIYAVSGLGIVLLSWTIVNVVMWLVTY